jgi:molybdopterin-guanine dinucleotide biosynthesis protein A
MDAHADATWLVVACDLPRLDADVLSTLVQGRNAFRFGTAFAGHEGLPEPLCTLYEPKARVRLHQFLAAGWDCPRKMLINSPISLLGAVTGDRLANVNSPADAGALA